MTKNIAIRLLVIIELFVIILFLSSCGSKNDSNLHTQQTVKDKTSNSKKLKSQIYDLNFINSSQQYGFGVEFDKKLITNVYSGIVFNKVHDSEYIQSEWVSQYLNEPNFRLFRIYKYNNIIVYIGYESTSISEFRQIILQDTLTGKKKKIELKEILQWSDCYIHSNKIYFDENIMGDGMLNSKYVIKSINIDTQEQETLVSKEMTYADAMFKLRKSGEFVLLIQKEDGASEIYKYSNNVCSKIISKKLCYLVDYDQKGIYYRCPDNPHLEEDGGSIERDNLILRRDDGTEKFIFKIKEDCGAVIFDSFIAQIDYSDCKFVEKYDLAGNLIKRYEFNKWPNFGRKVITDKRIVYYNGCFMSIFYTLNDRKIQIQFAKI